MPDALPPDNVRPLRQELAQNLEAEQAVLGALLVDGESFRVVKDRISADDFYLLAHQRIFGACCELNEDGDPIDAVSVMTRLTGAGVLGKSVPVELPFELSKGLGTAGNAKYYADVVSKTARVRHLQLAAESVLARSRTASPDEVFAFAQEALGKLKYSDADLRSPKETDIGLELGGLQLVRASEVQEEPVEWLIPGLLARRELNDLSGDPGVGKGGIVASWSARITREHPKASVLYFGTEDRLGHVTARLRAEGADRARVFLLDIRSSGMPRLPSEIEKVEALVRHTNAVLIAFDPALEAMDEGLDSHKQQDVQNFCASLGNLAHRTGCAALTIRHFNKASGVSAMYKAAGSIAFNGRARMALVVGKDKETGSRVLTVSKGNVGKDTASVSFDIIEKDGSTVVAWGEASTVSADELVNQEPKKRRGPAPASLEAACDVLRAMLSNGPMKVDDILRCAKAEGISRPSVYRAKQALHLVAATVDLRSAWRLSDAEQHNGNLRHTPSASQVSGDET